MRLFTSIFCTLFLALSAFGQAIDYRALRTNQFSTNVPSRGYVGIIGYGVTNIPGTNVQFNSGTGITFTTNGAAITITATGTNQTLVTNVVVRAGDNVTVTTNGPTDWTINALDLWATNAPDGSITNINTISGTAYVSGTNGLLVLDNAASGKNILLTGETNGTPSFRLRSDGSMFLGKHVTNDVNIADFTTTYPLYFNSYTLSNDPALASFKIGNQDQNGIPTFFSVISGSVLANKDTGNAIWQAQAQTTNGLIRTWQIRAKPSLSQLAFATETNTAFKVDDKGDISIIKSVPYLWPATNGGASQFLTTDGGNPQQLSWTAVATGAGSNSVAVAAGTNIFLVTNTGLVTINVANTNLPVVVAGTNVTVVTNGIEYTVSSTAVGGGGGAVGPGTINQVAKFVATTNVGDSIYKEVATNMWVAQSRWDGTAYTNHITNTMVGQWTSPTNWTALSLVSGGPDNEYNELHAVQGSSHTTGVWPLKVMDTWSLESTAPVSGHTAGELFPVATDTYIIGDNSHLVNNISIGTGGIDVGIAATKPALRFHNLFTSTWFGVDGTGSSLAFYRDTGITAAFDKPNGNLCFDVAGNYIGFGVGISNCTAFLSTGEAVTNGLVQIGTNSAVASPVPAGIMSSRGSGTDKGGADLVVAGGVSTGTGTSGKILFATSGSAAGSSPTLNGLTNRMEIDPGTGNVTIYSNLTVNGSFSAGSISDPNALTNNDTRNITFTGSFTDTRNGVSTVIDSNTITSGMITLSGSGTNYFGANVNVNGTVNATGYTNSGYLVSTAGTNYFSKLEGPLQIWNDQYHTNGSYRWAGGVIHSNALGTTVQAGGNITNSGVVVATNGFSSRSNIITLLPTNAPTDGNVLTATGTAGDTKWAAPGGGSQTPWTSDINGGGFKLTNAIVPIVSPGGFVMPTRLGQRVLLNEDFMQQSVGTAPSTLAGSTGAGFSSGLATEISTNHVGIWLLNCANAAGNYTDLVGRQVTVFSSADWYIEYSIQFSNAAATMPLSNGVFRAGWYSTRSDTINQSDGAYAQLENITNVWKLVTANNTTKTTNITATVGWTTGWQTIGIYSPSPNTNAILYINGTAVTTNTSNMPNGIARITGPRIGAAAGASGGGDTVLGCYLDYVWMAISPNSWP